MGVGWSARVAERLSFLLGEAGRAVPASGAEVGLEELALVTNETQA